MRFHKTILINGRFLLQPVTGVQRYAREVIGALNRLSPPGLHFIIAVPSGRPVDTPLNMDIFYDKSILPSFLWQQIRLPLLMKKTGADLLWSPCNIGPVLVRNHIVTIHDASVFAGPSWFSTGFRIYYRWILPMVGRRARRVVTVSEFSAGELLKYHITTQGKLQVIKGGVGNIFHPVNQRPVDHPYVFTVGSRDPRKNVSRLLKAWKALPPEIKGKRRLLIAGMDVRAFSREDLGAIPKDVEFKGYIPDNDLPYYYSGADLFVFPSMYEGFGLPPLEAMACGCPVIVSNTASLPEVCGDAAYYIDPHSVKSITGGIERLLKDYTLRKRLIEKGLERARLFTWGEAARKYLEAFEKPYKLNS